MLIDTDVNSRFHSCTLNWIPVILLSSAKQTTTKYEQVLYWRHTCIILFSCFLQKVLENPWFTCYLPKINKLYYQRDGAGRGNNRFGNMDYWWVHVLEGARVVQWWAHSPPTNVAWVQLPASTPYVGERFFSGYSGCPLFSKTNTSKFQFDLERMDTFKRVHMNSKSASWVKKQFTIYNFLHCTFQVTSQIIYCYCTLLSYWDNGKRRSRGSSCHRKGTLGRWPYLEKMLLFDCYLLCPSTVSLKLWRQTLWHTSGLRQLVNERLYPPLWMKGYFIWRLTTVIHTLGLILH